MAQAIPMYSMQVFKLPHSIIVEIEKMCRAFFWGQKKEERRIPWVSWENLCCSKKDGGRGMRDLEAFNQALLAKQGWRILNDETSLMSRVLKNKYFPNSTFLEAKSPATASFTWKSILQARNLLKKGVRKVIGNGKDTRVWGDPWAPTEHNEGLLKPRTPCDNNVFKVSELIEGRRWNTQVIDDVFLPWDAGKIKGLILSAYDCPGVWTWRWTKNGEFSVKSAYYIARSMKIEEKGNSSKVETRTVWQQIWRAKVPPKVRNFAWKAVHNALPVNTNLRKRQLNVDPICGRCGEKEEDVAHLLLMCKVSQRMWYLSPLRMDVAHNSTNSFKEWVLDKMQVCKNSDWWEIFWMLCWSLWLGRNDWSFKGRGWDVMRRIEKAVTVGAEYKHAVMMSNKINRHGNDVPTKWEVPRLGFLKLNTYAAFKKKKGWEWGRCCEIVKGMC